MTALTPAQQALLNRARNMQPVVHGDGSVTEPGIIMGGQGVRTAYALERLGLGTTRYHGPNMVTFRANPIEHSDPYPWRVEVIDRTDAEHIAARDGERIADPAWVTFWDAQTERLVFDPRTEGN